MDYINIAKTDIDAAQRIQERYNLFLISLVFTTLAFSIQTAPSTDYPLQILFELTAWASLLISGGLGLYRWRYIPNIHGYSAQMITLTGNIEKARELKSQGHETLDAGDFGKGSADEFISKNKEAIELRHQRQKKLNRRLKMVAISHRVFLLLGFTLLMASRGYEQVHSLLELLMQ